MTLLPIPADVDQIAEFNRIRDAHPLHPATMPSGDQMWLATKYADVKQVYSDSRLSRNLTAPGCPRMTAGADWSDSPLTMSSMDGEEHLRRRRPVVAHLTPKRVEALRGQVVALAERLLDELVPPAEFVEGFAAPMPTLAAALVAGIPEEDYDFFRHDVWPLATPDQYPVEAVEAAGVELITYMIKLADIKRREPGDDMATALVRAADEGAFPAEMLPVAIVEVMFAGMLNTRSILCSGLLDLLREPEKFRAIAHDEQLQRDFTEQAIRLHSHPVLGMPRIALEDVEVGGVLVRKGEALMPVLTAANHDPQAVDQPHIAFGFGPHRCIGANLARMQMQVAFGAIARKLPNLRLTVPAEQLPWTRTLLQHGLQQLPVTW